MGLRWCQTCFQGSLPNIHNADQRAHDIAAAAASGNEAAGVVTALPVPPPAAAPVDVGKHSRPSAREEPGLALPRPGAQSQSQLQVQHPVQGSLQYGNAQNVTAPAQGGAPSQEANLHAHPTSAVPIAQPLQQQSVLTHQHQQQQQQTGAMADPFQAAQGRLEAVRQSRAGNQALQDEAVGPLKARLSQQRRSMAGPVAEGEL